MSTGLPIVFGRLDWNESQHSEELCTCGSWENIGIFLEKE